jgi:hypothetical protein
VPVDEDPQVVVAREAEQLATLGAESEPRRQREVEVVPLPLVAETARIAVER